MGNEYAVCLCAVCVWIVHVQRRHIGNVLCTCLCTEECVAFVRSVCLALDYSYSVTYSDQQCLWCVFVCTCVSGSYIFRDNTWVIKVLRVCVQYVFG